MDVRSDAIRAARLDAEYQQQQRHEGDRWASADLVIETTMITFTAMMPSATSR
jgi:hypothetical protein